MIIGMHFVLMRRATLMAMHVTVFEEADRIRQKDSHQQSKRQPQSIVRMELHFGQQIAERDADEHAG